MKNIKLYIQVGGVILIIILAGLYVNERKVKLFERSEKERVQANLKNSFNDSLKLAVFYLREKEVTGKIKRERDSLAKALDIKPKQIIKFVDRWLTRIDSVPKYITLKQTTDSTYYLNDIIDNCTRYEAMIIIEKDSMEFKRLGFYDDNKIDDVFYWYRKWFLGKKRIEQIVTARCGDVKTREINIIKK